MPGRARARAAEVQQGAAEHAQTPPAAPKAVTWGDALAVEGYVPRGCAPPAAAAEQPGTGGRQPTPPAAPERMACAGAPAVKSLAPAAAAAASVPEAPGRRDSGLAAQPSVVLAADNGAANAGLRAAGASRSYASVRDDSMLQAAQEAGTSASGCAPEGAAEPRHGATAQGSGTQRLGGAEGSGDVPGLSGAHGVGVRPASQQPPEREAPAVHGEGDLAGEFQNMGIASGGPAGGEATGAGGAVLVFEVQDPAGPLDAAEGALGAKFGELKVASPARRPQAEGFCYVTVTDARGSPVAPHGQSLLVFDERVLQSMSMPAVCRFVCIKPVISGCGPQYAY